jgi:hypothetical protein
MITVKVNGTEVQKYKEKKKLAEVISELYPKDSVLNSVRLNHKSLQIADIQNVDLAENQLVELTFISVSKSILQIADSAIQFLDWVEAQNLDEEIFSILPRIVSGFETLESAILSIRQFRKDVELKEEEEDKNTRFIEINSFIVLTNKIEVVKRIKEICGIYRKIFLRILETEGV